MKRYFFTTIILCLITMCLIGQSINASEEWGDFSAKSSLTSIMLKNSLNSEEKGNHKELETKILFLCTGNSCRSQIAEGWTRYLGKEFIKVKSAGIKAYGLNPRAIAIMKESDIDITGQSSKIITSDMIEWANIVVTVCGDADENCPLLPSEVRKIHWPISDPAKATGSDTEIMSQFRAVSSQIHQYIIELLSTLRNK